MDIYGFCNPSPLSFYAAYALRSITRTLFQPAMTAVQVSRCVALSDYVGRGMMAEAPGGTYLVSSTKDHLLLWLCFHSFGLVV